MPTVEYEMLIAWIRTNPEDESITDKTKQRLLNFVKLEPEEQAQLIIELRQQLKERGLPKEVEACLPWLTFNCNELPDHMLSTVGTFLENESGISSLTYTSIAMRTLFQSMKVLNKFVQRVAYGEQNKAEELFTHLYRGNEAKIQHILRSEGRFTDYSGRAFNCTAYEYAYWAKDTHMCCMLECYMDEETKTILSARIDEMERIDATTGEPVGLVYQQNGVKYRSAHFDFTPLKDAYQRYLDSYNGWIAMQQNQAEMDAAWLEVGKAQRNVPAHVAQEYCRTDRSFYPTPEFNEATLPRGLDFYNWITEHDDSWFPLAASTSGFGFDFALIRGQGGGVRAWHRSSSADLVGHIDLAAITRLDEVRTVDLKQSREHLNPPAIPRVLAFDCSSVE